MSTVAMSFKLILSLGVLIPLIRGTALIISNVADNCTNKSSSEDHQNPFNLNIVSREKWFAKPPAEELIDLELSANRVIIAHTVTRNCSTRTECTSCVQSIQTFHIESRGWSDIGYNFLVGGDGAIYEGRGWTKEGAHTKGFNKKSICFAFIGTFNTALPPPQQLEVTKKMIDGGVELGVLDKNYKLYGHRQLVASESPGATLYEEIRKWPHWSDIIDP